MMTAGAPVMRTVWLASLASTAPPGPLARCWSPTVWDHLGARRASAVIAAWWADPRLSGEQVNYLLGSLTWPRDTCDRAVAYEVDTIDDATILAREIAVHVLG